MYGSRSTSRISTLESQEFICSRDGGAAWLFSCSISSEKVIELPSGGLVLVEVSVLISVDKVVLLYAVRELRVKQDHRLHRFKYDSQIAHVCPRWSSED